MNDLEIDNLIQLTVSLKHQGVIKQAKLLLEVGLGNCERDKNTTDDGYGKLYKSIAKLNYIQSDFEKAKQNYFYAIYHFRKSNNLKAYTNCLFHLGCCSEIFFNSGAIFEDYILGLQQGGGTSPGETGNLITAQMADELLNIGISMYKNALEN